MATRSSVARARLTFGRERTAATGPRRGVLLDRGRRDQVVRVRCGAGGGVSRLRSHARDRLPHSGVAPSLERSHRLGRGGVRCRGASLRVRQQADHGGEQRVSSGDEPAIRRRPRAVAAARAGPSSRPPVHGGAPPRARAAVHRWGATVPDGAPPPAPPPPRGGGPRPGGPLLHVRPPPPRPPRPPPPRPPP